MHELKIIVYKLYIIRCDISHESETNCYYVGTLLNPLFVLKHLHCKYNSTSQMWLPWLSLASIYVVLVYKPRVKQSSRWPQSQFCRTEHYPVQNVCWKHTFHIQLMRGSQFPMRNVLCHCTHTCVYNVKATEPKCTWITKYLTHNHTYSSQLDNTAQTYITAHNLIA